MLSFTPDRCIGTHLMPALNLTARTSNGHSHPLYLPDGSSFLLGSLIHPGKYLGSGQRIKIFARHSTVASNKSKYMKALFTLAVSVAVLSSQAQVVFITQNNNTFAPTAATVEVGESVTFTVSGVHTATQVSEETWMANGNTPLPDGFNFSSGIHEYVPTEPGTIYFVCMPHAGMGMKGQLVVELGTGIEEPVTTELFRMFPNPASDEMVIEMNNATSELVMIDVQGREVMRRMVAANERVNIAHLIEGNYTAILRKTDGSMIGTQRVTIAR
jgi:plastocyanin